MPSRRSTSSIFDKMADVSHLLPGILDLHDRIHTPVVAACEQQSHDSMAEVAQHHASRKDDRTVYATRISRWPHRRNGSAKQN